MIVFYEVFNLVILSREGPPPSNPVVTSRGYDTRYSVDIADTRKTRSSYPAAKLEVTFEHQSSGLRKWLEQIVDIINTSLLHNAQLFIE